MNYRYIRKTRHKSASFVGVCLINIIYSGAIYAHAQFTIDGATPPRYNTDSIKTSPPCGAESAWASYRSNRKGIFLQGQTITLEWIETVNHPGSFEFDFAAANDEAFVQLIPPVADTQDLTPTPHYYSQTIQLNYDPCDACTLRMSQNMGNQGNYYYSCADIVIVSGNDVTPPQEVSGATANMVSNGVQIAWTNPADSQGTIVLRNTAAISGHPSDRTDYITGDSIGNAQVVYKGSGTGFIDINVAAGTEYTYAVFTYDADYNYNSGVSQTITTAVVTDPGGDSGGDAGGEPDGSTTMNNTDSGGGAGSWALILLATLLIFQRPAWKKLM
jgi:hypothetical protein